MRAAIAAVALAGGVLLAWHLLAATPRSVPPATVLGADGTLSQAEIDRALDFSCGYSAALDDITDAAEAAPSCQRVAWLAARVGMPRVRARR